MSVESGKNLAGIGSIFLIIPFPFLGIVGIILVLLGMKNLSEGYGEPSIYRNALYGVIFGIISAIGLALWLVSLFFGINFVTFGNPVTGALGFFFGAIVAIILGFIFGLLEAIYLRMAFDNLANKSGVGLFRTGGLLLLIGAILTIILIGFFIIFIAWILILAAFFSIPTTQTQSMQSQPMQQPPPQQ